jgi:hypothetical protein
MKKIFTIAFSIILMTALISCEEEKQEDLTNEVNKNGSVESSVTVDHLDSANDILITKHAVWVKGNKLKDIEHRDTVPALGIENTIAENSEGDTKSVAVKKDYEIFITVK